MFFNVTSLISTDLAIENMTSIDEYSCFDEPDSILQEALTTKVVEKHYDDGDGLTITFYDGNKRIGKASTVEYEGKPNAFLHGLEVNRELRGKGYGTEIMKYMIKTYDVSILYVRKTNRAVNLYKRFGFRKVDDFDDGSMLVMKRR